MICPNCGETKRIIIENSERLQRKCLSCYNSWLPDDDIDPESVNKKGSYEEHQKILEEASLRIQKAYYDAFFIPRIVGLFFTKRGNKIQIGLPGQADAYVLLPCEIKSSKIKFHVHIELEFKSGKATLSKFQKNWRQQILDRGGLYIVVRNPDDIVPAIEEKYGPIICRN